MSEESIKNIIESINCDKNHLAEIFYNLYKDKIVEIYLGDEYEQISVDQIAISYPSVLCGKVLAAYGKCLLVNCAFVDQNTKKISYGNIVCIHDFHIKLIKEINNQGMLKDTFLKSQNSTTIKSLFGE